MIVTDRPHITIGGRTIVDPDSLAATGFKILAAAANAGNYSTLRDEDGTLYIVPGGKQFRIVAISGIVDSTSAVSTVEFLYADTSVTNGGIPTAPVFYPNRNAASGLGGMSVPFGIPAPGAAVSWVVPTGKYPTMKDAGGVSVTAIVMGFEETP
jgi:hypothetical protein